jgi:hypothetical protein
MVVVSAQAKVSIVEEDVVHTCRDTGATTSCMELEVDDGMSWDEAIAMREEHRERMKAEGASDEKLAKLRFLKHRRFHNVGGTGGCCYLQPFRATAGCIQSCIHPSIFHPSTHPFPHTHTGKTFVVLAVEMAKTRVDERQATFRCFRPANSGGTFFKEWELMDKYAPCSEDEVKLHWSFWHDYLKKGCLHGDKCKRRESFGECIHGARICRKYLITGAVLPVLNQVFKAVNASRAHGRSSMGPSKNAPRALRATTVDGRQVVGLDLRSHQMDSVKLALTT